MPVVPLLDTGIAEHLRRSMLLVGSGVATALCVAFWLIGAAKDVGSAERVILPALTAIFGGIMLLTWSGRLRHAEIALLSVGGGVLLERLHFTTSLSRPGALSVADAYELMIWLPCIYVFSCLLLDKRTALLFNLTLLGASMWVLRSWLLPGHAGPYHADLTEFYVGQLGCVVVVYAFAHLKDRFLSAHRLAIDLRSFAETDFLTEVSNRRGVSEGLEREIKRAARERTPMAVMLLDLDRFKSINDTHGHDEGDRVLRRVAFLIEGARRDTDLFGRWGGEEFLLVAPGLDRGHAIEAAERLRRLIERSSAGGGVPVTASFGVSEYLFGDDADTLVKRADEALMQAKEAGRNRVCAGGA